ncbi:MAG: Fur family transcriptional regulator [Terriglobales bacterium]
MFCDAVIRDASRPGRREHDPEAAVSPLMAHAFDRRSLLSELKSRGVRLTAQRRAVVEVIQEANEHLDAGTLLERARARGANVDRATVYRTVELLKKYRLVDELDLMHLQGEKHYYEARTRGDHVHLACLNCGRILECATPLLDWLKLELATRTGFELKVTRLEVGGYCAACRAAHPQPEAAAGAAAQL